MSPEIVDLVVEYYEKTEEPVFSSGVESNTALPDIYSDLDVRFYAYEMGHAALDTMVEVGADIANIALQSRLTKTAEHKMDDNKYHKMHRERARLVERLNNPVH